MKSKYEFNPSVFEKKEHDPREMVLKAYVGLSASASGLSRGKDLKIINLVRDSPAFPLNRSFHMLKTKDRDNVKVVNDALSEKFELYLVGSAIDNHLVGRTKEYGDIDILAVDRRGYWDGNRQRQIDDLRESMERDGDFRVATKQKFRFEHPRSKAGRFNIPSPENPEKDELARFVLKPSLPYLGLFQSSEIDLILASREKIDSEKPKMGY
jgi:hypothetical protein